MRLAVSVVALKGSGEHRVTTRGLVFPDQATARLFAQYIADGLRLYDAQMGEKAGEPGFAFALPQAAGPAAAPGNGVGADEDLLAGFNWSEKKGASSGT